MTEENYISYIVGTAKEYPMKIKRHLKKLLVASGVVLPEYQMRLSTEADTAIDVTDKELTDQVCMCLQNNVYAQHLFEKWEYEKDYKYSVLFGTEYFDEWMAKTDSLDRFTEGALEFDRTDSSFSSPLCWDYANYTFLKFSLYYSAVEPVSGEESLLKYPVLIVLHHNEKIIEFRFDTLRRIFIPERQEQTFYSDLINRLLKFCHVFFGNNPIPLNLEFLQKYHPDATLMGKYMMLPSGGNAQLDVGKNQNYILPIIGELKEILSTFGGELASVPTLKEALEQFMLENDELSECTWIELMWENEIKTRSIRVKFIYNYRNHHYCLLQHYYSNVLIGMERMNHVVRYISKNQRDSCPIDELEGTGN